MSRKVVFRAGLVLVAVAMGLGVRQFAFSSPTPSFRFVTVERGDIQSTVSTTGTLGAVTTVNVLEDEAIRQGIKDYSNWPTIPQLYVKGEFVGGSDIMMEMYESGELQPLLDAPKGA